MLLEHTDRAKTALVTGASSGIGASLARQLATQGWNLVLVARNQARLELLANDLERLHQVTVDVIAQDLSNPGAANLVHSTVTEKHLQIDCLVNNAGAGRSGLVTGMQAEDVEQLISLNMTAMTELSRLFAADMVRRGRGQILNVASTGSYQPGPYTAVYYAAKAYVHSFSLALAEELRHSGVAVSLLCPGATATEFSSRAGKADLSVAMAPEKVALAAMRGLSRKKRLIIPGWQNRLVIVLSKLMPGHVLAKMVARIQKPLVRDPLF